MRVWIARVPLFLLALACVLAAPWALSALPVEQKSFLLGSRPSWEGILTVGVVESFDQGNLTGWLSARAREFEGENQGVLVSVREMNVSTYRALRASCQLPDALVLGPGVEGAPEEALLPISGGSRGLRQEAVAAAERGGLQYGLPLALGAYGLLGNQALVDGLQIGPETSSEAMARVFEEQGRWIGCPAPSLARPDLALEALAPELKPFVRLAIRAKAWPEFALDQRTVFYVGTQREVLRMRQLQAAGRGFDTCLLTPGEKSYTDQVLYLCAVNPSFSGHGGDAASRLEVLGRFAALLLGEEAQGQLTDAGLFAAREGLRLYQEGNMAALEAGLEKPLDVPAAFG